MQPVSPGTLILAPQYGKVICEPNWRWNRSSTPFTDFDIWYIWQGEGELVLNGQTYEVKANDCYLFRPGDRVDAAHNPARPLAVTFIHFSSDEPMEWAAQFPAKISLLSPYGFESYLDHYVRVLTAEYWEFAPEARMLLALILLAYAREALAPPVGPNRPGQPHYAIMHEIAAAIRENPGGAGSIAELARRAHLSPRYFSLKFKAIMGQTIENYILEKKIERAAYLLAEHGMAVGEVADALGYQNIYYFSKQFKQFKGVSPSKWLRQKNSPH